MSDGWRNIPKPDHEQRTPGEEPPGSPHRSNAYATWAVGENDEASSDLEGGECERNNDEGGKHERGLGENEMK